MATPAGARERTIADAYMEQAQQANSTSVVHQGGGDQHAPPLTPVVQRYPEGDAVAPTLLPKWYVMLGLLALYTAVIVVCALIVLVVPVLGLFLLACSPSVMLVAFLVWRYNDSTDVMQLALTTLWAIALLIPLVAFQFVLQLTGAYVGIASLPCAATAFIRAYLLAGFLEELLKYNAIRAILHKDLVADPRALLVYAAGASNGFALVENILYVFDSSLANIDAQRGLAVGIARAFLSVPSHTADGLLSGTALAARKFLGVDNKWYTILPLPVFIHGTYNFALFLIECYPGGWWYFVLFLVPWAVTIIAFVIIYYRARKLHSVPLVEVKALQAAGVLPRATCGSCADDCAACWHGPRAPANGRYAEPQALQQMARAHRERSQASTAPIQPVVPMAVGATPVEAPSTTDHGRLLQVVVPDDMVPGASLRVVVDGRELLVAVPEGAAPGTVLVVAY